MPETPLNPLPKRMSLMLMESVAARSASPPSPGIAVLQLLFCTSGGVFRDRNSAPWGSTEGETRELPYLLEVFVRIVGHAKRPTKYGETLLSGRRVVKSNSV